MPSAPRTGARRPTGPPTRMSAASSAVGERNERRERRIQHAREPSGHERTRHEHHERGHQRAPRREVEEVARRNRRDRHEEGDDQQEGAFDLRQVPGAVEQAGGTEEHAAEQDEPPHHDEEALGAGHRRPRRGREVDGAREDQEGRETEAQVLGERGTQPLPGRRAAARPGQPSPPWSPGPWRGPVCAPLPSPSRARRLRSRRVLGPRPHRRAPPRRSVAVAVARRRVWRPRPAARPRRVAGLPAPPGARRARLRAARSVGRGVWAEAPRLRECAPREPRSPRAPATVPR